jgi:hypothetical protein
MLDQIQLPATTDEPSAPKRAIALVSIVSLAINLVGIGGPGLIFLTQLRADVTALQNDTRDIPARERRLVRVETQQEEIARRLANIEAIQLQILREVRR